MPRIRRILGSYGDRVTALPALKHLMLEDGLRYHGHIIMKDLRGYCLFEEHPVRWYRSCLTVLAVADGYEVPRHPIYTVTCGECWNDFECESIDREYCSSACKQKAYRKRLKAERSI